MRAVVGLFYWFVVGLLALFPFVSFAGVWLALSIPAALALFGVVNTDWSCSMVAFDGISNPRGGYSGCSVVSIDLILLGLGLWAVALLGAVLVFRGLRPTGA